MPYLDQLVLGKLVAELARTQPHPLVEVVAASEVKQRARQARLRHNLEAAAAVKSRRNSKLRLCVPSSMSFRLLEGGGETSRMRPDPKIRDTV